MLILIILGIATFLRFFRLEENLFFNGEVGMDFLIMRDAILNRSLPLIGPPSAHSWLSVSPLFYWLMTPFLWIFRFSPLVAGYFGAIMGVALVFINFLTVKKLYGIKPAFFSSFLISISPLWLYFSREARFTLPLLVLLYPFLLAVLTRRYFLMGLLFGLMLDFHYSAFILIPAIVVFYVLKKYKVTKSQIYRLGVGFLFGIIPLIACDVARGGKMLGYLVAWVPYRVVGFFGLYPKNNFSPELWKDNLKIFTNFFTSTFWTEQSVWVTVLLILIFIFTLYRHRKETFLILWAVLGFLALFIHGRPSIHYFLPVLPIPILVFSLFFSELWRKTTGKALTFLLLSFFAIANLNFFFSQRWAYAQQQKLSIEPFYVPYKLQKRVARKILELAGQRTYQINRVGPFDIYERSYAQNYVYLTWYLDHRLVKRGGEVSYTIYEDPDKVPKQIPFDSKLFWVSNIAIEEKIGK